MSTEQPVKPESKDPLKEALDHPDGASLEEMLYGKEEKNNYPNQNEKEVAEHDELGGTDDE